MQETQNYKLKKIDKETDKILDSIDYLNQNFDDIDKIFGDFETDMTNLIEGDGI